MQILLNGEPRQLPGQQNLAELLELLQLGEKRLAVEVNGEIVPRSCYSQQAIKDGDRLEIVNAIGGGQGK